MAFISALAAVVAAQNATVCPVQGTKTINNQAEADSIAACPTFTGSISIINGPYATTSLNGIKEITGTLTTKDGSKVAADSLERIGGTFENHDSYTVTLDFPKLSYVAGISMSESYEPRPGLNNLLMPSLETVDGDITVTGLRYLNNWQMPSLQRVNGLFKVIGNPFLFSLTLDKLETVAPGGIDISGSFWNGVSFASLQSVHPKFSFVFHSPGNCTEFAALREPGGPLASTEQYSCVANCADINADGSCARQQ
ncbi:cell wall protein Ecm33 [Neofusicoccum ribis]|uniref:Cell wall protein Ecm33 n=1 Tax=Neofusicoccum ribis TaxID=45134 RepID=A0ABR3SSM3_9PEZI